MSRGDLGFITTPAQHNLRPEGAAWCADNGCFGKGYPGDEQWLAWLAGKDHLQDCRFATAPDVVGDAHATYERSLPFLSQIRALGYPAAYVGQDGQEDFDPPWAEFDALFIGGTTEWKLGPAAASLVAQALDRGKWVHMGRVNSRKRLRYAHSIGCHSVDGTYLAFGPSKNLPPLLRWLKELEES